jgi:hypothetical protein
VPGTLVELTAEAPAGWKLGGWSGACRGAQATCAVAMTGHQSVSAAFVELSDKKAPTVRALPSTGKRGEAVRLRYRVGDDSGKTLEYAKVYRGKEELATIRGSLREVDSSALFYFLSWRPPADTKPGAYRFCVWAEDEAGNDAGPSCASLRIT